MIRVQAIDDLVKEGFAQKLTEQFRCPAIYITSPDKLKTLQVMLGNKTPSYPYLFLNIQSTSPNIDWYGSRRLARYGIPVQLSVDGKQAQNARLFPTNFEVEVTFVTNKYSGDLDAVEGFVRRWLFARRSGYLQYTVNYGLSTADISCVLADSVPMPPRENPADQESVYQVVAQATIKGYISEPELAERQVIHEIQQADESLPLAPGAQFFPFPTTSR